MPSQTNPENAKKLKDFGRKLAAKRMAAGVDRQAFADKCGISYKHYFNLENGDAFPSLPTYISICRVLGLTLPLIA